MNRDEIIRSWRDQDFYLSLSDERRAQLPANPAGMIELSEDALINVLGASHSTCFISCHPNSTECSSCSCNECSSCFTGTICCC